MPEETSPSGENMEAKAETGTDGEMELQPEDTGEAPAESDGAAANANNPALELPSETGAEDRMLFVSLSEPKSSVFLQIK